MQPSPRNVIFVSLTVLLFAVLGTRPAAAGVVYTTIVDTSQVNAIYRGNLAISDNGSVAFLTLPASGLPSDYAIMTGNGGALTTIATGFSSGLGTTFSINASGTVAFTGNYGSTTVFTGNGGALTTIATAFVIGFISINNSGYVAFATQAYPSYEPSYIFLGNGGPLTTIATGNVDQNNVDLAVINNHGIVAFTNEATNTIYAGTGGQLTPIAGAANGFASVTTLSINDSGTVLFLGTLNGAAGYFTSSGGGTFTELLPNSGAGNISLNNSGEIAYEQGNGIFLLDKGVTTELVRYGSELDGSTVTGLVMGSRALNDSGQVAFYASLADGQSGVFVATLSVPEPSSLAMLGIGSLATIGVLIRRSQPRHRKP